MIMNINQHKAHEESKDILSRPTLLDINESQADAIKLILVNTHSMDASTLRSVFAR
jgi:hypothetical protein